MGTRRLDLDDVKRKEKTDMARWGSVEYIKEKYLGSNEDYAPLSKDT